MGGRGHERIWPSGIGKKRSSCHCHACPGFFTGRLITRFGADGVSASLAPPHGCLSAIARKKKTRVQSLNDFTVFGTMAVGSFASGSLLAAYDWNMVLWVSFLPLVLAVAVLTLVRSADTSVAEGSQ